MESKLIITALLISLLLGVIILALVNKVKEDLPKTVTKIMYDSPIGPAQQEPFQLKANLLEEFKDGNS